MIHIPIPNSRQVHTKPAHTLYSSPRTLGLVGSLTVHTQLDASETNYETKGGPFVPASLDSVIKPNLPPRSRGDAGDKELPFDRLAPA